MPHYQCRGIVPPQRFVTMRRSGGGVYYEHLLTAEGFNAEDSILYRLAAPSRVARTEVVQSAGVELVEGPAANALFRVDRVSGGGDFLEARQAMIASEEVVFSLARPDRRMEAFYRNGWCDELVLVVEGEGVLRSQFGDVAYRPLDILYIPRGDTVQWLPDDMPQLMGIVESRSPFGPPPAFVKPNGQLRQNAPYHERDMRAPELFEPIDEKGEFPVLVRTGRDLTRITLDHHPFDVVGWDGFLYPYAVSMQDIKPLSGRIHLMPDQYAAFVTPQTMISLITPRQLADIPDANPSQAFHQNLDYDEVLYRIAGGTGVTEPGGGTFTLHPRGFDHGPKPGFENAPRRERQDVWAFMIDSRSRLKPTLASQACVDSGYADSWTRDQLSRAATPAPLRQPADEG